MANLSAANSFTPGVLKQPKVGYSVSISGTFVGKVTVQRSKDGVTWADIAPYTAPAELDGEFATAFYIRAGFNTGDYTSGSAAVNVY